MRMLFVTDAVVCTSRLQVQRGSGGGGRQADHEPRARHRLRLRSDDRRAARQRRQAPRAAGGHAAAVQLTVLTFNAAAVLSDYTDSQTCCCFACLHFVCLVYCIISVSDVYSY